MPPIAGGLLSGPHCLTTKGRTWRRVENSESKYKTKQIGYNTKDKITYYRAVENNISHKSQRKKISRDSTVLSIQLDSNRMESVLLYWAYHLHLHMNAVIGGACGGSSRVNEGIRHTLFALVKPLTCLPLFYSQVYIVKGQTDRQTDRQPYSDSGLGSATYAALKIIVYP